MAEAERLRLIVRCRDLKRRGLLPPDTDCRGSIARLTRILESVTVTSSTELLVPIPAKTTTHRASTPTTVASRELALVNDLLILVAVYSSWPTTLKLLTLSPHSLGSTLYNRVSKLWYDKSLVESGGLVHPEVADWLRYYWTRDQNRVGRLYFLPHPEHLIRRKIKAPFPQMRTIGVIPADYSETPEGEKTGLTKLSVFEFDASKLSVPEPVDLGVQASRMPQEYGTTSSLLWRDISGSWRLNSPGSSFRSSRFLPELSQTAKYFPPAFYLSERGYIVKEKITGVLPGEREPAKNWQPKTPIIDITHDPDRMSWRALDRSGGIWNLSDLNVPNLVASGAHWLPSRLKYDPRDQSPARFPIKSIKEDSQIYSIYQDRTLELKEDDTRRFGARVMTGQMIPDRRSDAFAGRIQDVAAHPDGSGIYILVD